VEIADAYKHHGTAVMATFGSVPNGKGTTGIAHNASKFFAAASTSSGWNVGAAVMTCASAILAGDVIVIEQQLPGPNNAAYVPVEWYKPTFDAIKVAAVSRVVVEAAGNGSENLDSPIYSTGNGGHYPFKASKPYKLYNDSGAIIVGAGLSPFWVGQARSAKNDSNYGFRVDLQGWGDSVVTAGKGDLYSSDGVNWYYTAVFNGTSSATAIVSGAVASLQGRSRRVTGGPILPPSKVKQLLVDTGTPQTGTKHIGPLPDLGGALCKIAFCESLPAPTNLRINE
jgi:hypothetical protein